VKEPKVTEERGGGDHSPAPDPSKVKLCQGCGQYGVFRWKTCSPECARIVRARSSDITDPAALRVIVRQEKELADLRKQLRAGLAEQVTGEAADAFLASCLERLSPTAPEWVRVASSEGRPKVAIPTFFGSDQHFGEVVDPATVEWMNGYDRHTALLRLKRFFGKGIEIARDYVKGIEYPGCYLALGGDTFSGSIHEELARTNAGTVLEEVLYWLDPMASGIQQLAREFGAVHVVCVPGNHSRLSRKPMAKLKARDNLDWLFYHFLRRMLGGNQAITWDIPQGTDATFEVFDTRYRLTHGDQFRGGTGIAGMLSPIMLGDHRKRKRAMATGREFDYLLVAHWHQLDAFRRVIVNGSLKGYDEFAYDCNFDYQEPLQSWWLTDPRYGRTISAPIFVKDPGERWMRKGAAK
jgi:hypothetical protein